MIIRFNAAGIRQTRWYELAIRFGLGGVMTMLTGLIAAKARPVVGGLFLAFPAIFPASVTLIEKHARERKEKRGLAGARRGRETAALDARGAILGSAGLLAFACVAWLTVSEMHALALVLATLAWVFVATAAWFARRRL